MKPRKPLTLFIDRSLGRQTIARALRGAGAEVEIHDDHFAADAPDEHWLSEVGKRGWVVLTKDKRIKHRSLELIAVARADVRLFQLTAGNLEGREMAAIFVRALRRIARITKGNPAPFIANVTPTGRASVVLNRRQLRRLTM